MGNRILIYHRDASPVQTYKELCELLTELGYEVDVRTKLSYLNINSYDVLVGVNCASAVKLALIIPHRPVVFYSVEVDLPSVIKFNKSRLVLPWVRFEGVIVTSKRRLDLAKTYIRSKQYTILPNQFYSSRDICNTTTERERAAVYIGSGGPMLYECLKPFIKILSALDIPLDIYPYSHRGVKIDGVRNSFKFEGDRKGLVSQLNRYQFGILPLYFVDANPSFIDFLATPGKLYYYLAAQLHVLTNISDGDDEIMSNTISLDKVDGNLLASLGAKPNSPDGAYFSLNVKNEIERFFERVKTD